MAIGGRDVFTAEIVRNALVKCAVDMRTSLQRTAYSPPIYEAVDLACGIIRANRDLLAESSGIPAFLGNLVNVVAILEQEIGFEGMRPEDVYFLNDPYCGGGTHCNDFVTAYPVFCEGELLAFAVTKAHVLDVGGMYMGGWFNSTTEVYQEGLRVPPVRLYSRGEACEDILRILRVNSRTPEAVIGDVRGMVGSVRTGGARILEVVQRFGRQNFEWAVAEILDHAEETVRAKIAEMPDGMYEAECWLDGDGDQSGRLSEGLRIHVQVKVVGDEMVVDLSESSDQSIGPMNSPKPNSVSFARYGFKALTTPFLPNNEGCFRPLRVVLREGSIFDPVPPAATSLWAEASMNIPELMMRALAPAVPGSVRASTFGSTLSQFTYGVDSASNRAWLYVEDAVPGGWGAKSFEDGESALLPAIEGDTPSTPVEVVEASYPLRVGKYELTQDSAGPGLWRGGLGVVRTVSPTAQDCRLTATFERTEKSPPWGLFSGRCGSRNRLSIVRCDGSVLVQPKVTNIPVHLSDSIVYQSGGGGGYGDPFLRDPMLVLEDVKNEYVSVASAASEYGVVVHVGSSGSLSIDEDATARLRQNVSDSATAEVKGG